MSRSAGFFEGKEAYVSVPARLERCLCVSIMHVREVAELIPIHLTQGRDLLLCMPFLPVFLSLYSPSSPSFFPCRIILVFINEMKDL